MKKSILVLLSFAMGGCGSGSGGGNGTPAPEIGSNSYVEEAALAFDDTSRFAIGCTEPGTFHSQSIINKIDSRLQQGSTFESVISSTDEKGNVRRATFTTVVKAKNQTSIETAHHIKALEGVVLQSNQTEGSMLCQEDRGTILCDRQRIFYELQKEVQGITETCRFDIVQRETKLSKGSYTFANGKAVAAFRQLNRSPGTIECEGRSMEEGEILEDVVYSNDVPAIRFSHASCGGERIFDRITLRGKSGKVYWVKSTQILTVQ